VKILSIECFPLVLPIREIYGGAAGFLEDCRTLLVRVEAEGGVEGWGEATQGRPGNTYETLETMTVMARSYFAPPLIGMDLKNIGPVVQKLQQIRYGNPLSKAAIETALFDALARHYRIPLYLLLGGPYRNEIALTGGLGLDLGPKEIVEQVRRLKKEGFSTFKLKIGQRDRSQDVARVRAVREEVGDEATIRVDGNGSYSFVEAREILNELVRFHIADAEQPLARGDLQSLAELRKAVGIPIAAQESVSTPEDVLAVARENAADLLKIKLTHIGGFKRALQVAAIADGCGLPVVVGQGSACTAILSAAEMHLHAALKNGQPGGEMTGFMRLGEQGPFGRIGYENAKAYLNSDPGLGLDIDRDFIESLALRSTPKN
jgi:L-alanine-DL-glutamate epimerase-like enolase superfamily enzyme